MAQWKSVPKRLLHSARRVFLREVRAFELTVAASTGDENETELETDIEVPIATGVTASMVRMEWNNEVGLELTADGTLLLMGLRNEAEYRSTFNPLYMQATGSRTGTYPVCFSRSQRAPASESQFYPELALSCEVSYPSPYLIIELDVGYHSMVYWHDKAEAYLDNYGSVGRVVVVKLFPLRRSALAAGLWKRAAVAVVLGRVVVDEKDPDDWEMAILEERSFGNAPLARNIRQALATVATPTRAAPRGDLQFEEPQYADISIQLNDMDAWRRLQQAAEQHPHVLTISVEGSDVPWRINLGEVLSWSCQGWAKERASANTV